MEYNTVGGSAMHKIIEKIGFGKFHVIMITILGLRRFVGGSNIAMVTVLGPYLRCSLELSVFAASWIVLCRSIGKIFSPIIVGKISDFFGRKKTMLLFFTLHSYLSLMTSLSSSYPMILLSQTIVGTVLEYSGLNITRSFIHMHWKSCPSSRESMLPFSRPFSPVDISLQ